MCLLYHHTELSEDLIYMKEKERTPVRFSSFLGWVLEFLHSSLNLFIPKLNEKKKRPSVESVRESVRGKSSERKMRRDDKDMRENVCS